MNTPQSQSPEGTPAAARGKDSARKAIIGLAAALAVGTAAAVVTYYASEADAWVGSVNGHRIPRDAYNRDLDIRKRQYQARLGVDFASENGRTMLANLRKDVLGQLIERQLLLAEAESRKLTVTDPEVETRVRGIKTSFPDPEAFKKALQENGINEAALRDQVKDGILIEKLRDELTRDATLSLADARAFYDKNPKHFQVSAEVKASHILVKTEKEAQDLVARLKGGADFTTLARERSEDTGSKEQGGDLGFFGRGRMVPEFEQAAFALRPGQVSKPTRSQFGYHVIKVTDRREAKTRSFDEVRSELSDQMLKQKREEDFRRWLAGQRNAAKILIRPQYDAAAGPATGSAGADGAVSSHGQPAPAPPPATN